MKKILLTSLLSFTLLIGQFSVLAENIKPIEHETEEIVEVLEGEQNNEVEEEKKETIGDEQSQDEIESSTEVDDLETSILEDDQFKNDESPTKGDNKDQDFVEENKQETEIIVDEINDDFKIEADMSLKYKDENNQWVDLPASIDADFLKDKSFSYTMEWSSDRKGADGFSFEFDLPSELFTATDQTIEVKNGDDTYATYTIKNNKVKFEITYPDKAPGVENFEGSLEIKMTVENTEKLVQKDYVIKNPFNDAEEITIKLEHKFNETFTKQAESKINQEHKQGNRVYWSVELNKDQENLGKATLEDKLSDNSNFLENTLKIYEVNYYADGTLIKEGELAPKDVTQSFNAKTNLEGNLLDIEFDPLDKAYIIEVETEVKEENIPLAGGEVTVTNTAKLIRDNEELESISVDKDLYFESIAKKTVNKSEKFYEDRTLNWTVTYNPDFRKLENPQFEDVFNNEVMTLDKDNITVILTAPDGSEQKLKGSEILKINDNGFEFPKANEKLKEPFDQKVTIEYTTKIKDGIVIDGNSDIFWNRIDIEEKEAVNVVPELANEIGIKHAHGIDYANQKVKWQIIVNPEYLNIKDVKITDYISGYTGHFFTEEDFNPKSFTIKRVTKDSHPNHVGEEVKFDIKDKSKEHFELEISETNDNEVNYKYVIEYTSSFDKAKPDLSNKIINRAKISFSYQNEKIEKEVSAENKLDPIYTNNGAKYGEYNAETKTFTWYLFINTKQLNETTTVIDTLTQKGHKFIKTESLKIAEFNPAEIIAKNKENNISYAKKLEYSEANKEQVTGLEFSEQEVKFTLHHKEIENNKTIAYVVKLESTLDGAVVNSIDFEYTNTADLIDKDGNTKEISDKVKIPEASNGNLNKQGKISKDDSRVIDWEIKVNYVQSTLTDVVVKDKLDNYQAFVEDSFKIFPVEVKGNKYTISDTELEKDKDYTLTIDEASDGDVAIIMLRPKGENTIATPYLIKYQTIFSNPEDNILKNKVIIDAINNESEVKFEIEKEKTVEEQSSGTSGARSQKLKITKKADNNEVMKNVKFSLYSKDRKYKLKEGMTNFEGELSFDRLFSGEFILIEEMSSESGYVPFEKEITLPQVEGSKNTQIDVKNQARKIELDKKLVGSNQSDRKDLENAEFKLEIHSDGKWEELENIKIELDDDNKFIFSKENSNPHERGLKAGKYRITEIQAPTGYILNNQPIEFDVNEHENLTKVTLENYQGRFEMKKVDEAGNPLAGAEFTLYDENDDVKATAKSDNEGRVVFDQLAPGSYYVKETEAPDGYAINIDPINFEISSESKGKPEVVKGEDFTNYQGRFEMKKVDEAGNSLAGAEFKLYDQNDKVIATAKSDNEGLVVFDQLAPGSYYVKETEAPDGYAINIDPINFEISSESKGKPEVVKGEDFTNYQGRFEMKKVDEAGKPLAGAEFKLYDQNDEEKATAESDNEGRVVFDQLAPGSYYVKETIAPDGYVINIDPINFEISSESKGKPEVVKGEDFTNYQGHFEMKKFDEARKPLANAEFKLYDQNHKEIATAKSDNEGRVVFDQLAPGSYYVKETKAPDGYAINKNQINFEISFESKGKPEVVQGEDFTNYQGRFEMKKVDAVGNSLANAEFTLYDENDDVIATAESDNEGLVVFDQLAPGSYYVKETKAPDGYAINTKTVSFYIANKGTSKPIIKAADFVNYKGSYQFTKVYENENPKGASVFEVYDADGTKIDEKSTNEDNQVHFDNLAPGTYTVKEISTDSSYLVNSTEQTFTIEDQYYGEQIVKGEDFTNYQGRFEMKKVDAEDNPLANAEFTLYDENDDVIATAKSDNEGLVVFDQLAPGSYYVKETKAPDGYAINTKTVSFYIANKGTSKPIIKAADFVNYKGSYQFTKVYENENPKGASVFELYDADGTKIDEKSTNEDNQVRFDNLAPGTYTVKEISTDSSYLVNSTEQTFTIEDQYYGKQIVKGEDFTNYQGRFEMKKVDAAGNPLAGAEFTLYDENDDVKATAKSDNEGRVVFDQLAPGSYYVKETKAPDGYAINTKTVSFYIANKGTSKPIIKAADFVNYKGSYQFTKVYENENPNGASVFEVYDANGTKIDEKSTNEDNQVRFDNLAPGTYTVKEISTDSSYLVNSTEQTFTIEDQYYGKQIVEGENFKNYQGMIRVEKTDEFGNKLEGAHFSLYSNEGELIAETITNKEGEVIFDELSPGIYILKETQAPKGYVKDVKQYSFEIKKEFFGKQILTETIINHLGSFKLVKTDKDGKALSGAEFTLYDQNDAFVAIETSDKNGVVIFNQLAPGSYYVKETKAPKGYIKNTKVISFFISEESHVKPEVTVNSFKNYQGVAIVTKTDENNEIIKNGTAVFNLLDEHKNIIRKNIKTKNGQFELEGLEPGVYYLEETKAPKNYIKTNTLYEFEITSEAYENVDPIVINIVNEFDQSVLGTGKKPKPNTKPGSKLPSTGVGNTSLYVAAGAIVLGMVLRRKRQK